MVFIIGFISCLAVMGIAGLVMRPRLGKFFFVKSKSHLSFEDTLETIRRNVDSNKRGWFIAQSKDYNRTYEKKGKGELPFRLHEFKIGNPNHSFLVNRAFPAVSTFMPAAIAVVEYRDGKVVIYRKNTALMGKFFRGVIRKVMCEDVPLHLNEILTGVV